MELFCPSAHTPHTLTNTNTDIMNKNTDSTKRKNQLTNHHEHWGLTPPCPSETFEHKKVQKRPPPQKKSYLERTWSKYINKNLDLDSTFCQDFGKPQEKVQGTSPVSRLIILRCESWTTVQKKSSSIDLRWGHFQWKGLSWWNWTSITDGNSPALYTASTV